MNWQNARRDYTARGVQVVAVVAQSSEVVRRYIEDAGLPFNILVDESRDVLKAYGVWHRFGLDAWNSARPCDVPGVETQRGATRRTPSALRATRRPGC